MGALAQDVGTGPGNGTARDEIKVNSIGVGPTVGYQWVSRRGFVVELCHGGGGFPVNRIRHTGRYSNVVSGPNDYLKLNLRPG